MNPNRTNASTLRSSRSVCPGASGLPRRLAAAALGLLVVLTLTGSAASAPASARASKARVAIQRTHRVAKGETAVRIARRYGISLQDLLVANKITDPNRVLAGSLLVIPKAGYAARVAKAKPAVTKAAPAQAKAAAAAPAPAKAAPAPAKTEAAAKPTKPAAPTTRVVEPPPFPWTPHGKARPRQPSPERLRSPARIWFGAKERPSSSRHRALGCSRSRA